ncbi:MAG: hypothetical protein ABEH83_02935 [Halobacterium sp.]
MNLEDLRAAQTRERATDGLQELRDSFYSDVAEYISELKAQRETAAAAADDPFGDPEVQELTDKIETAEQVAEAIYERRMGKLVKQASLAAAGMPDDANGLTDEERTLYDDLVDRIEANKAHVLDVISGEADPADADAQTSDTGPSASGRSSDVAGVSDAESSRPAQDAGEGAESGSAAAAMGGGLGADDSARNDADSAQTADDAPAPAGPLDDAGGGTTGAGGADETPDSGVVEADPEPSDAIAADLAEVRGGDGGGDGADGGDGPVDGRNGADGAGDDVARTTVRVTDDVGEIFGMDEREYTLEAEDVVTLPEENAKPLVEKGAAEELDD